MLLVLSSTPPRTVCWNTEHLMYRKNRLKTNRPFNYREKWFKTDNPTLPPNFYCQQKQCMLFKVYHFLSSSNFLKHYYGLKVIEGIQATEVSKYTMASWILENSWSELKNIYLTNTWQSQNLNFIALLFYLMTGALERSTFSSGDWLKGFLLLGTNYDSAWF